MAEQYRTSIGTDAVKLTTSRIITLGIALLSAMLLSRFRSLEEYGTYSQLLLAVNLATSILMIGLPNSINYFLARADSEEEKQNFLSVFYSLSTILSILSGIAMVGVTPLIANYFNNELISNFIYFLALYPWATIIASSIDNILIVYQRTSMLLIYKVLNSASLLSIIFIVEIFNLTFNAYMLLFLAVQAIFAISVYIIVKELVKNLHITLNKNCIKEVLTFSIPIGLASMVGTLNIQLGKLAIGNFYGTEQLAIYANASTEMPVTIIAASLTAILMPQLVRLLKQNKNKEAIELWGDAIILSYIIICFFASGFFTFAYDAMSLLYSDKYLPGVSVFRVFNVVLLLRCTYFGIILNSKGNTKLILYSSVASLTLNVVLTFLFLKVFGFIGPAIATLVSTLLMQLTQLIATSIATNIKIRNVFPWIKILKITVINIIMSIVFYIIKVLLPFELYWGSIAESIMLGTVWVVLYFLVLHNKLKEIWANLNRVDCIQN